MYTETKTQQIYQWGFDASAISLVKILVIQIFFLIIRKSQEVSKQFLHQFKSAGQYQKRAANAMDSNWVKRQTISTVLLVLYAFFLLRERSSII